MRTDLLTPFPLGEVVGLADTASHPISKTIAGLLTDNGLDANLHSDDVVVEITPTTSVHWTHGVTPTATTSQPVLTGLLTRQMRIPKNHKLAFIKLDGADNGNVYVHPCRE
jgi:hypothetical protein